MIGKSIMKNSFLGFSPGAERTHPQPRLPCRGGRGPLTGQPKGSPEAVWVVGPVNPSPPRGLVPLGLQCTRERPPALVALALGPALLGLCREARPTSWPVINTHAALRSLGARPRAGQQLSGPTPPCPPALAPPRAALRRQPAGPGRGGTAGCCGPAP